MYVRRLLSSCSGVAVSQAPMPVRKFDAAEGARPRVLVVDDDPGTLSLLGWALEERGFRVVVSTESETVQEQLRGRTFSAVILDLQMPRRTGWEVLERLRDDPKLDQLPVLLISSDADTEVRVRGLEAGAEDVMKKPVDVGELALRLERVLHRRRAAEPALAGNLGYQDLGEVLQYLASGRKTGFLEVQGELGSGGVELTRGKVESAWLETLSGRDAVLSLLEQRTGAFRLQPGPWKEGRSMRRSLLRQDSVEALVMTAAWLQDELAVRVEDLPPREQPLVSDGKPVEIPTELAVVPISRVWQYFLDQEGASLGDLLEARLASPAQLRLAVAWLCRRGRLGPQTKS